MACRNLVNRPQMEKQAERKVTDPQTRSIDHKESEKKTVTAVTVTDCVGWLVGICTAVVLDLKLLKT